MMDKKIDNIQGLDIENGVMIPKKGMLELGKLASEGGMIAIGFRQNNCIAKKDTSLIVIRLLESKFPDYNSVIPKDIKHVVKLKREDILDGMKKMIILSTLVELVI